MFHSHIRKPISVSAKSRDIRDAMRIVNMSRSIDDVKFLVAALGTASVV